MTTLQRLAFDANDDLMRLHNCHQEGRLPIVPSLMREHFRIAKEKPDRFRNHARVLAFSVGGSNTKVMIASMEDGELVVHHVAATANPDEPTPVETYLDHLIVEDPAVADCLRTEPEPAVFFSLPVAITDGVPHHVSKIPTVTGLVARDLERDASTHHFGTNFAAYLKSRGLPPVTPFYFCDGVVAHHGGVAMAPGVTPDRRSILMVCGTGLATSDEEGFVITGQAPLLDHDEELYPYDETDGHQYQFCAAGKGLYGIMRRAAELRAQEADSALAGIDLDPQFQSPNDSFLVAQLWWSTLPHEEPEGRAAALREQLGAEAYRELQVIARQIMERGISIMANSIVFTAIQMGATPDEKPIAVFFEGSCAKDRHAFPRVKDEVHRLLADDELFNRLGVPPIPELVLDEPMNAVRPAADLDVSILNKVDLTLIGAATTAVADACLR